MHRGVSLSLNRRAWLYSIVGVLTASGTAWLVCQHWNRPSGAGLLGVCLWLTLTGYGLYYVGGESRRLWLSRLHWLPGLLWPVVLCVHIWIGRRTKVTR